ncbi:MAG: Ig-like domain-containing protein [Acidobacteria bacterium]|jgi:hypothetical protein|nr:Ig-like domain-containing protein [Acidobacteriota bacterium]
MIYCKNLRKLIALIIIFAFVFQADLFLFTQEDDDVNNQFELTKSQYINGQYGELKGRLERLLGTIFEKHLEEEKKDILGACYLLLGAIYEKEGGASLAEENYGKAKEYGVESIDGLDLNVLPMYRIVIKGDIDTPFQKAVDEYNNGQYDNSKTSIEQVIGFITKYNLDKKKFLGKCYLLLGAIYEKKGETLLAEEYYRKALEYGVKSIKGVDLGNRPIYEKIVKGIIVKVIEKRKKKFPVLFVIGGVAVVAVAVMLLTKKSGKGCTIAITSPFNNETVTGTVTIQAAVTGNCVVDRVEFYIDTYLKGSDSSEPYSYVWDTETTLVGPHTLRVVAYSTTGNYSSQITVTVAR